MTRLKRTKSDSVNRFISLSLLYTLSKDAQFFLQICKFLNGFFPLSYKKVKKIVQHKNQKINVEISTFSKLYDWKKLINCIKRSTRI